MTLFRGLICGGIIFTAGLTAQAKDESAPTVSVWIHAPNSYHSEIVLSRKMLKGKLSVLGNKLEGSYVSLSFGNLQFFRNSEFDLGVAINAALGKGPSTVFAYGIAHLPQTEESPSWVKLDLSAENYERLTEKIAAAISPDPNGNPVIIQNGLFDSGSTTSRYAFLKSDRPYSLINNCNGWIGSLLSIAGCGKNSEKAQSAEAVLMHARICQQGPSDSSDYEVNPVLLVR